MNIESLIEDIGEEMLACPNRNQCAGISFNLQDGIFPRCLYLESRDEERGVVIVGINPGRSNLDERDFYKRNRTTYKQIVNYWEQKIRISNRYYDKMRQLVTNLGFDGTILWTELVKCEIALDAKKLPPLQTFRNCTQMFLTRELNNMPDN